MKTLRLTDVKGKKILVRLDLDLPEAKNKIDFTRLELGLPTLSYLFANKAKKVSVIAHWGRPDGKASRKLSFKRLEKDFFDHLLNQKAFKDCDVKTLKAWITLEENLRFDKREEAPNMAFAKKLAKGFDLYVFDAFAVSHRDHTSVTRIPEILPTVTGIHFYQEMTVLKKLLKKPKQPFVVILGGGKPETKVPLIDPISEKASVVMVGGTIPKEVTYENHPNRKLIIGELKKDGLDLSDAAIEQFERFIVQAETLVWNGPMGKYEDSKSMKGTARIADAISRTRGFKVIGGGDTEAAVSMLKINQEKAFTHVCSGGGALLEYLAKGDLAFLEALRRSQMEF